jgi:Spy/CpxP family protein refolding chaperone
MKQFLLALCCFVALASNAQAFEGRGGAGGMRNPEQREQMQKERFQKQLGVTAVQADSILAANKEMRPQMMRVMRSEQAPAAKKEAIDKLRDARKQRLLKAGLTAEQIAKLEQMEAEQMERLRERRSEGGPGGF